MSQRTWFIVGVSSGFGHQLTDQLLVPGDPARMAASADFLSVE
jgi:hypothetical protein